MSQLGDIEDGLVQQLTGAFTNPGDARPWLNVQGWPVRPENWVLAGAGDVLVIYKGARYKTEDLSSAFYTTPLEFEITLRARTLRDHQGAYQMLELARQAVCGKRLPQAAGTTLAVRDSFVEYGEGAFAYSLVVELPVVIVQGVPDAPGLWLDPGQGGAPLSNTAIVPA